MRIDDFFSYSFIGVSRKNIILPKKIISEKLINDGILIIPKFFKEEANEFNKFLDRITTYQPINSGALNLYKSGKPFSESVKAKSSSKYYNISHNHKNLDDVKSFVRDNFITDELIHTLSLLSGYMVKRDDISYSLGVICGENSNSEWHTDVFCNSAKAFIYLSDVDSNNSPFEFLSGSQKDLEFRSKLDSRVKKGAARLFHKDLLKEAMAKFKFISSTGPSGTLIVANTCGIHRKGKGDLSQSRLALSFGTPRHTFIQKFIRNFKYRFSVKS